MLRIRYICRPIVTLYSTFCYLAAPSHVSSGYPHADIERTFAYHSSNILQSSPHPAKHWILRHNVTTNKLYTTTWTHIDRKLMVLSCTPPLWYTSSSKKRKIIMKQAGYGGSSQTQSQWHEKRSSTIPAPHMPNKNRTVTGSKSMTNRARFMLQSKIYTWVNYTLSLLKSVWLLESQKRLLNQPDIFKNYSGLSSSTGYTSPAFFWFRFNYETKWECKMCSSSFHLVQELSCSQLTAKPVWRPEFSYWTHDCKFS